ncbi:MAG TPA: DUF998 domain-containing protein, partial [Pseudolysinimonas sp.]
MTERLFALVGTLCMAAALVLLWLVRLSLPYDLYVSELGAPGMPTARVFQIVLLLIVVGGALIAWAGRGIRSRARILRWWTPSISLAAASAFFLVDSQVTCTYGCPLPVGATFTLQDFVHTLAAVLAFAAASWAIMQCAFAVGHPVLARFSLVAALAVAAISTAGGLMSLFQFQAVLGSRFELLATTIGLAWVVVFGASLAVRARSAPHGIQKLVGQPDQTVDLVVVPVDP